jgi:hypothetical protein
MLYTLTLISLPALSVVFDKIPWTVSVLSLTALERFLLRAIPIGTYRQQNVEEII